MEPFLRGNLRLGELGLAVTDQEVLTEAGGGEKTVDEEEGDELDWRWRTITRCPPATPCLTTLRV